MTEQTHEHETITESSAARLAYYCAWVPIAGFFLFIGLAFIGVIQIGKGRIGFNRLSKGFIVVVFTSILPIAGLVWWGGLPCEYYIGINNIAKHGRVDSVDIGQTTQSMYYYFGKQAKTVTYNFHNNGQKRSETTMVDGKLHGKAYVWDKSGKPTSEELYIAGEPQGKFSRWYENGQLMAETTYENGKPIGESTNWYDNGNPSRKENYVNGKRQGRCIWYTKDGKVERTMDYTNGISQEQIDAAKQAGVEPVIEVDLGGGVMMRMVFIPPGEFMMGSTQAEIAKVSKEAHWDGYKHEGPQHKVTIKPGFYLCETEVTQAQWKAIMQENPSYYKDGQNNAPNNTANHPVENISWNDVQRFLQKINTKCKGTFRLPSEAEWEYSARSGTTTSFGYGDDYADLGDYAWYKDNSGSITHAVSGKKGNNWGVHDMHGNVYEWCEDDWHETYQLAPDNERPWIDDPRGKGRLIRGGSWYDRPEACRVADRRGSIPGGRDDYIDIGFRLSKTLK